jgi:hypothetical protein
MGNLLAISGRFSKAPASRRIELKTSNWPVEGSPARR